MTHLKEPIPDRWVKVYKQCPKINQNNPLEMSPEEIKQELNTLIFSPPKELKPADRELLTIVIVREKSNFFDFLKGYTKWKTVGLWEGLEEKNLEIEIEFKDNNKECIGNRIMHLLWSYNKLIVGESILYARTTPLEEGTLD